MNEPVDFPETYSFNYSDGDCRSVRVSFTPGDTWPEVLDQFVGFLNNVYGYDIRQKIAVAESRFGVDRDKWTGPMFNPEESL